MTKNAASELAGGEDIFVDLSLIIRVNDLIYALSLSFHTS